MGCTSDLMLKALFKVQWCKYRLRTVPKGVVRSGALGRDHVGSKDGVSASSSEVPPSLSCSF